MFLVNISCCISKHNEIWHSETVDFSDFINLQEIKNALPPWKTLTSNNKQGKNFNSNLKEEKRGIIAFFYFKVSQRFPHSMLYSMLIVFTAITMLGH